MIYQEVQRGRTIMGRLVGGQDLLLALEQVCTGAGVELGELRAIGAVSKARIGYYDQVEKKYFFVEWNRPMEILSLLGNVSLKDGKPFVHAHLTLGNAQGEGFGGHLAEGTEVFACEFVLQEYLSAGKYRRELDEATGLQLWVKGE
ncbi:MAG: DUF296 domain-containing protein [Syntrophobacteraceae bacterium]|nr:DUF296 domain-containing protein [Syntrophobacteraceae bacterium]